MNLLCRIFGHRFVTEEHHILKKDGSLEPYMTTICKRCGARP